MFMCLFLPRTWGELRGIKDYGRDISWELQKLFSLDSLLLKNAKKWDPRKEKRIREVFVNRFLEIGLTIFNSAHFKRCQN